MGGTPSAPKHRDCVKALLLNLMLFGLARLAPQDLRHPTRKPRGLTALYQQLDPARRRSILRRRPPTPIQHDKSPINSGHTEYFFGAQPYTGMNSFDRMPRSSRGSKQLLRDLRAAVVPGDFDCIMLAHHPRGHETCWTPGGTPSSISVIVSIP